MHHDTNVYLAIEQLKKSNLTGLATDIDDTLCRTSDGFFDAFAPHIPPPSHLNYELFRKHYALHGKPLFWGEREDCKPYFIQYGNDAQFHFNLKPIPQAIPALQQLPLACYLTARPESMREKTQQWLNEHQFPSKPLIMRPNETPFSNHVDWKITTLEHLLPNVTGLIDNDTRITHALEQQNYLGHIFLIGLAPTEYQSEYTIVRENWDELLIEIEKRRVICF